MGQYLFRFGDCLLGALRRSGSLSAAGRCGRSLRSPEGRAQALHGAARGSFGRHISLNCYLLRAAIVAAMRVGVRRAVRPLCFEDGGALDNCKRPGMATRSHFASFGFAHVWLVREVGAHARIVANKRSHSARSGDRMIRDGPPRMVGR
ncbi:hypothetical protein BLAT2472_11026 [Burkholderia latens]